MRPLDGRRVRAPPPYVADWVPVYPVGQPGTDPSNPRRVAPLVPTSPAPTRAARRPRCHTPRRAAAAASRRGRAAAQQRSTSSRTQAPPAGDTPTAAARRRGGSRTGGRPDPPCRRRAPVSSITRSAHTGAGPTSPEVSAPPARGAKPSQRRPSRTSPRSSTARRTGRFTTLAELATANGRGVYPARVCAHDRITPVATRRFEHFTGGGSTSPPTHDRGH